MLHVCFFVNLDILHVYFRCFSVQKIFCVLLHSWIKIRLSTPSFVNCESPQIPYILVGDSMSLESFRPRCCLVSLIKCVNKNILLEKSGINLIFLFNLYIDRKVMNLTFKCMYIDITDHLIILSLLKTMINKRTMDTI